MRSTWSPERYAEAVRFAAEAHRGQTVPGTDGLPYLLHVTTVCGELLAALQVEEVDDPDLAMLCALLHDSVEDTEVTRQQLEGRFGAAVAAGVDALSKRAEVKTAEGKAAAMADSLRRIREQPREVWMVKLADRITNLAPPPAHWPRQKRANYRAEAGRILEALGEASPVLAGRLAERIEAYAGFIDPA